MHRLLTTLVVVLGWALTVTQTAWSAPFDVDGTDWEGLRELVRLAQAELGAGRVVVTKQIDFSDLKPDDGLLLLHPERTLDVDELSKFIHAGGRVVLLDDFGLGESLLGNFGMKRVPIPRQPAESLRHNPELALAEPASAHSVVVDVHRVVTNHPTGLSHPDLTPILKIRSGNGDGDVVIAVTGTVGRGRFLAAGDPSIVMNSMLRYGGNKAFARGLVQYAVDADASSKRGGRLFIASGGFEQRGAYGGDETWFSDCLRELRALPDQIRNDGLPPVLAYAAAIALGLGLVVWVGSRTGRLHKAIVPRFVRRVPPALQGGIAGHAAVIGGPQTTRALAVLELKSALEEQLAAMLDLTEVPGHQDLLAQVAARGLLDAEGMHTLGRLLLRMANVETMIVFQRNGGLVQSLRDAEVVSIASTVKQLLEAARANLRRPHERQQHDGNVDRSLEGVRS